jgi:hypothetical protein
MPEAHFGRSSLLKNAYMGAANVKLLSLDYKVAGLQGCKVARLQGCKVARLQGCKVARVQGCKVARLQGCKVARLQASNWISTVGLLHQGWQG